MKFLLCSSIFKYHYVDVDIKNVNVNVILMLSFVGVLSCIMRSNISQRDLKRAYYAHFT